MADEHADRILQLLEKGIEEGDDEVSKEHFAAAIQEIASVCQQQAQAKFLVKVVEKIVERQLFDFAIDVAKTIPDRHLKVSSRMTILNGLCDDGEFDRAVQLAKSHGALRQSGLSLIIDRLLRDATVTSVIENAIELTTCLNPPESMQKIRQAIFRLIDLKDLERAKELSLQHGACQADVAHALSILGKTDESLAIIETMDQWKDDAYFRIFTELLNSGNIDKAEQLYPVFQQKFTQMLCQECLGKEYLARGEMDKARSAVLKSIAFLQEDAPRYRQTDASGNEVRDLMRLLELLLRIDPKAASGPRTMLIPWIRMINRPRMQFCIMVEAAQFLREHDVNGRDGMLAELQTMASEIPLDEPDRPWVIKGVKADEKFFGNDKLRKI